MVIREVPDQGQLITKNPVGKDQVRSQRPLLMFYLEYSDERNFLLPKLSPN